MIQPYKVADSQRRIQNFGQDWTQNEGTHNRNNGKKIYKAQSKLSENTTFLNITKTTGSYKVWFPLPSPLLLHINYYDTDS